MGRVKEEEKVGKLPKLRFSGHKIKATLLLFFISLIYTRRELFEGNSLQ